MTTTTRRAPAPTSHRPHRPRRPARLAAVVLLLAAGGALAHGLADDGAPPADALTHPSPGAAQPPTAASELHPELVLRFAEAQRRAAADGVSLTLTSGLRTAAEQQQLVDEAVDRYGVPEAYRWVLPPEHSAHVQGLAVDVGPTEGAYWLQQHGPDLGLCPTYANEVWHFELLAEGATACPEPRPDSSWAW
ncbi:M15 family metallopeptidase [Cellulomonas sp.]|uniref:M15 family metallopeptidase n=1 Tax=Cellulomonas sp. TaxID=40001 RepID=UPI0028111EAC|nr:M15 family metallopeptidase [Cellulomonas sp.]